MKLHKWHTLIWGSFFLLTVGFVLHVYQLFYMAAAWGLLAPISYLLMRVNLHKLEVRRCLPSRAVAGESVPVELEIDNQAGRRRFLFAVDDILPEGLQASEASRQVVVDLAPHASRSLHYELVPQCRGVYHLSELRLTAPDLLGMYESSNRLPQTDELIVYPKLIALPHLWPSIPTGAPTRAQVRRKSNQGLDLYGVRKYLPGDDLRRIHWKATAHTGELVVTERERRYSMAATAVIDLSRDVHAGRGNETTLEYGVTLTASLLDQVLRQRGVAQLIARGARDYSVPFGAPGCSQTAILESLARIRADSVAPLLQVLAHYQKNLSGAGAVAVITPQIGDEMHRAAATLQSWGNSIIWFSLVAPTFEDSVPAAGSSEARYHRFAQTLRRRGCPVYLIRGDVSLAANFRRWQRAVS